MSQKMFQPQFTISLPIANALATIERARGFLEAANLSEDWIAKMQNRALTLEAYHTTHIEGTHLNLDQSEKLIKGERISGVDAEDVKELLNYRKAFDFVDDYVFAGGAITEGLIREIHKKLVEGVRENSAQPGQYRKIQNFVSNSHTNAIIYTPPPAYEVPLLMAELVKWLQDENKMPAVLIAGIAQFQLVHIHPFLDGNGRTARLLSTLYLYRSGYDFKKLFTISEYYDRNRLEYYKAIQSVRDHSMDMTAWLEYFTMALATQMIEIQERGSLTMKLAMLAEQEHFSDRQKLALEFLLEKDMRIQDYEKLCPDVNRRTLQRDLEELVHKEIIQKQGHKKAAFYSIGK